MQQRVGSWRGVVIGLVLALVGCGGGEARPNVVVIMADDLGWADVGFHGGPIATPNIDALASQGIELERLYTAPMCTPTRAMLMTGRDPIRMGLAYEQINPWDNAGVPADEHFMPESFRAAGYQTAMVGKWHLGHTQETYHPNARGFDYYYGHLNTAVDYYRHTRRGGHDWQRNGRSVDEEGEYVTTLQGQDAARVIRERDEDKPIFLYVAFNAPHNPMQAPEPLIRKYADLASREVREQEPGFLAALGPLPVDAKQRFVKARSVYAAMVDAMDQAVGEILTALADEGIEDDTIVLFLSDNGGFNIFGADNTPLRGQKAQTFEGGVRVAAALRWPAGLEAGASSDQFLSVMDVFPTLANAAGVAVQGSKPLDGVDRWDALRSGESVPRERDLYLVSEVPIPGQVFHSVHSGPWKLVRVDRPGGLPTVTHLFHLEEDPFEQVDLSAEHPAIADDLTRRLEAWLALHPRDGLRRHSGPHPGWLPPVDWAESMAREGTLQSDTESEFVGERDSDPGSASEVLLYRPSRMSPRTLPDRERPPI
jgi:arylsulfatase A-like enzyme